MTDISANRTDLLAKTPGETPSDTHGKATERAAAQAALPMSRPPVLGPTRRPEEPVTAGLPTGPGRGYEPPPRRSEKGMAELRALLRVSRDPMLAIMIGRIEEREGR